LCCARGCFTALFADPQKTSPRAALSLALRSDGASVAGHRARNSITAQITRSRKTWAAIIATMAVLSGKFLPSLQ
jgi:hypothetical protein